MPGIFDVHSHLNSGEYENDDKFKLLEEAKLADCGAMINTGFDLESSQKTIEEAFKYSEVYGMYSAVGIHPDELAETEAQFYPNEADKEGAAANLSLAKKTIDKAIFELEEMIRTGKVVGIGEIGLDYYHLISPKNIQILWLNRFFDLAEKYDLPVILHIRDAFDDALKLIKARSRLRGMVHCFTGTVEDMKRFVECGFYISFAGNLTFKKGSKEIQEAAKQAPIDRILVETDAPYLTPEPHRGRVINNTPKEIVYTVRKLAELIDLPYEEVVRITSENACRLFHI